MTTTQQATLTIPTDAAFALIDALSNKAIDARYKSSAAWIRGDDPESEAQAAKAVAFDEATRAVLDIIVKPSTRGLSSARVVI